MSENGTPRWVKIFGIMGAILLLAFLALHLFRGGFGHQTRHSDPDTQVHE